MGLLAEEGLMEKEDTFTFVLTVVVIIALVMYGVMGASWGLFCICLAAYECSSSKRPPAKPRKRTGVRVIDALAFFGLWSLYDDDDGWDD